MKALELLRAERATHEEKRAAALEAMEAVATAAIEEERSLTDADTAEVEARQAELVELDATLSALDEREAELVEIERATAERAKRPSLNVIQRVDRDPVTDVRHMRDGELRDAAHVVLDDRAATSHLSTDQMDKLDGLLRSRTAATDGSVIARRLLVTEHPEYRSAFAKKVTSPNAELTAGESEAIQRYNEYRAMSIGTDTSGGFGVPVLIDPSIILTSQGSLNPFRRISRQVTITNDEWKGVSSAGVSWSFDAEAAAVSDDTPTLVQPSVPVHMARGFIPFSIEIGGDYPGFAQEMSALLIAGYDEIQAQKFAVGSGSGEPTGIVTALDANTNVEVSVTTDGSLGAVDVRNLYAALPDRFKANATWVMSSDVQQQLSSFGSSWGADSLATLADEVPRIKGRPVEVSSYFADFTGTTGAANLVVVGDFSNFLIADRAGMSVELIPHLFDVTNNRPTGSRGWFAWARVGSDSINDLGFRLLQNT